MTPGHPKSPIVCDCLQVTEAELLSAVREEGLQTVKEVVACTGAGEGCTACHPLIRDYLERERLKAKGTTLPSSARRDSPRALPL